MRPSDLYAEMCELAEVDPYNDSTNFTLCEQWCYTPLDEVVEEIDTIARSYYAYACKVYGWMPDCTKQGTVLFQDSLTLSDIKQVDGALEQDDLLGVAQYAFAQH